MAGWFRGATSVAAARGRSAQASKGAPRALSCDIAVPMARSGDPSSRRFHHYTVELSFEDLENLDSCT